MGVQFGPTADTADVRTVVLVDNGFEQRLYRTRRSAPAGLRYWSSGDPKWKQSPGKVLVYRLDEEASAEATKEVAEALATKNVIGAHVPVHDDATITKKLKSLIERIW